MSEEAASNSHFEDAIRKTAPAVVVLRVCNVRAFDGEGRSQGNGTGFVVDKENGLILTNRHIVSPGPVQADATFLNKEEVYVRPVYRDPVHDSGFFKFDPKDIRFMDLVEIPLAPEKAKVGLEIRVVGNDAGEKLSILSGTLARLDRVAPHYGNKEYNDHNTFYYAAASSTSGGSSGSPVIDSFGNAVAINAGGKTKAASSFYLPLDRVVRALEYVRKGESVPRRTIQVIFKHQAFAEAERLGLKNDLEKEIRTAFTGATGLLVVSQVVPEGPGDRAGLQPGDVLLRLNGELIHEFLPLEDVMDSSTTVDMMFQRGDEVMKVTINTGDLHDITPNEFLELSGAIVHPLSYQQAINHTMKPGSVFVASAGFMLGKADINWNSIILSVGDVATPDLDSFEKAISQYPDRSTVSIRSIELRDRFYEHIQTVTIDRTWFLWRRAKRCDHTGLWDYTNVREPEGTFKVTPQAIRFSKNTSPAIVIINFDVPFQVDGIPTASFVGTGFVVDSKRGLVVCDRNTVPNALGSGTITFAGSVEVAADVVLVHPMHNFCVLKYDPGILEITEEQQRTLEFEIHASSKKLETGDTTRFLGLSHQMSQVSQNCVVTNIERLLFSLTSPPRFTARNQVVIHVDKIIPNIGGVFLDADGKAQAFWFSFSYQSEGYKDKETFAGVHADVIYETIESISANLSSCHFVRNLGADLIVKPISKALSGMNLSAHWVERFSTDGHAYNHIATIRSMYAGCASRDLLKSGDLILAIDEKTVVDFPTADRAVQDKDSVDVTVLRNLEEKIVQVPVLKLSCEGTSRLIIFAGMFLQIPHPAVGFRGFYPKEAQGSSGVYCSRWFYGSPAHKYGVKATNFIIAINDKATPTLDDLVETLSTLENGQFVRIRTVSLNEKIRVQTLKCDYHYWPTVDLKRDPTTFRWTLELINGK